MREGLWRFYSPEGWLDSEGDYAGGYQSGEWIYYDQARRVVKKLTMKEGLVDGPCWIYKNGKLIGEGVMTGQTHAPVKQGDWKAYYINGRVKYTGVFVTGKKSGQFREYHDNGEIRAQGEYLNNKRVGDWIFYLRDGKSVDTARTGNYIMGKIEKK
ncbi:MAG: hypothetical protein E4G96_10055, partial [Chrysiogenales bacterium]